MSACGGKFLSGVLLKKVLCYRFFCIDGKFCFVYLYSSMRIWFDVGELGAIRQALNFEDALCLRGCVLCQRSPALKFGGKDVGVSQ